MVVFLWLVLLWFYGSVTMVTYNPQLTIYSLESKDLDHALLFALIKSKTDNNSAIEQMSMAINWNRVELAEEILNMETVQFNVS